MSKTSVLNSVRGRLAVSATEARRAEALARLGAHSPNTIPARTRGTTDELVAEFTMMLERVQGSVELLDSMADVPGAIERRLGAGSSLCLSPEVAALDFDWNSLEILPWQPKTSYEACVTLCLGAAAETGTLVVSSSDQVPLTQHVLGDQHIVILRRDQVVGSYEEIWSTLRLSGMPRHVTFISGPSCTGDIEMVMEYGAHGPRQLHVLVINDAPV